MRGEELERLAEAGAAAARLRTEGSRLLVSAVRSAADQGFSQRQIAKAVGRSQPEVSRLVRSTSSGPTARFTPTSRLGRVLADHRDAVIDIAGRWKAHNVRVFGSVATGEDTQI